MEPMEDSMKQEDLPERGSDSMGSSCWSRLLAVPVDLWRERSPNWRKFAVKTWDPVGDCPLWRSLFLKKSSLWKGLTLQKFMEDCLLGEDPHKECEKSSPWGGRSSRNMWWAEHKPHSLFPCAAEGEEVENLGVKSSPGRRKGWREGV